MRLLIILSPLLLLACTQIEHRNGQAVQSEPAQDTPAQVNDCGGLNYYHDLSGLSAEQQQMMLIALRQKLTSSEDPCGKLHLAMLLTQGDSGIRDEPEAEGLLKSLLDNPANSQDQDQALAILLLEVIELRKQAKADLMKMRGLRSKLKKATKASERYQYQLIELRSQLQQLQSLEQVIDQQEQVINPPKIDNDR